MKNKGYIRILSVMLIFALMLSTIACSSGGISEAEADDNNTVSTVDDVVDFGNDEENMVDNTSDSDNILFVEGQVQEIKLYIEESDYQDMWDNPLDEEWKEANVVINGEEVDSIAVRTKGNSTLDQVAKLSNERYSLKLDFDKYVDDRLIDGVETISLNNNYSDPTYMRDYLAYYIADEVGLVTPEVTYANVYINDELYGLFTCIQAVDEHLIEENFDDADGALYEPEEYVTFEYVDEDPSSYTDYELETDEETANYEALRDMLNEINNGTDYESVLDVDSVLKYAAFLSTICSMDSMIGDKVHNFYLYGDTDGVFTVLPWDYNMAFGTYSAVSPSYDVSTIVDQQTVPLIDKLLAVEEYRDRYYEYVNEIITGPMAYDNISALIEETVSLIEPYVESDPTAFYGYDVFIQSLTEDINLASYHAELSIDGSTMEQQRPEGMNPDEKAPKEQKEGMPPAKQGGQGGAGKKGGLGGGKASTAFGLLPYIQTRVDAITTQLQSN